MIWQAEKYTGIALGLGVAKVKYDDEPYVWHVCINLPFVTLTGWFIKRES